MSEADSMNLSDTLLFALSKCKQQEQSLREQVKLVENLLIENEKLKEELTKLRVQSPASASNQEQRIQELFQENTSKQVEIDGLKRKLKTYQVRAQRGELDNSTSSPLSNLSSPLYASGRKRKLATFVEKSTVSTDQENGLQENETKLDQGKFWQRKGKADEQESKVHAVEDDARVPTSLTGDSGVREQSRRPKSVASKAAGNLRSSEPSSTTPVTQRTSRPEDHSHPGRLSLLLSEPAAAKIPLPEPQSRQLSTSVTNHRSFKRYSTPGKCSVSTSTSRVPHKNSTSSPGLSRSFRRESEHVALRSKPLSRLSLNDFRRNPKLDSGMDGFGNDFDRERAALRCLPGCSKTKCCADHLKMLMNAASISPNIVQTLGTFDDRELLLRFIGENAEERLQKMTYLAKENLLQEARTRYIAEILSLQGKESDHSEGPPGMWSLDMPSTQEYEENQVQASRRVREEVERRYEEACRKDGAWIFADEINNE